MNGLNRKDFTQEEKYRGDDKNLAKHREHREGRKNRQRNTIVLCCI